MNTDVKIRVYLCASVVKKPSRNLRESEKREETYCFIQALRSKAKKCLTLSNEKLVVFEDEDLFYRFW